MELLGDESFRRLVSRKGISPPSFTSNVEAMEGVELLATVCRLGDHVLARARCGQMPAGRAEALILDLIDCYINPIARARRVIEIGRELRGHEG